jgi:hypothetical protein
MYMTFQKYHATSRQLAHMNVSSIIRMQAKNHQWMLFDVPAAAAGAALQPAAGTPCRPSAAAFGAAS